jgi:hypothetical protein
MSAFADFCSSNLLAVIASAIVRSKELPYLGTQGIRVLECREMTAGRHPGPSLDVAVKRLG